MRNSVQSVVKITKGNQESDGQTSLLLKLKQSRSRVMRKRIRNCLQQRRMK